MYIYFIPLHKLYLCFSFSLCSSRVLLAVPKPGASPRAPPCPGCSSNIQGSQGRRYSANGNVPPTSWQAAQETLIKFRSWE